MAFRTPYSNRPAPVYTSPGSPIKDEYEGVYDEYHNLSLMKVGESNLYDFIQSFRNECDINYLYERFIHGDVEALQRRQGYFMDCTGQPSTFMEACSALADARSYYEDLDVSVKSKYSSFEDFAQRYLSDLQASSAPAESAAAAPAPDPGAVSALGG